MSTAFDPAIEPNEPEHFATDGDESELPPVPDEWLDAFKIYTEHGQEPTS